MKIGNKVVTWKRPLRLESGPQIKSPVKTQPKRKSKEQLTKSQTGLRCVIYCSSWSALLWIVLVAKNDGRILSTHSVGSQKIETSRGNRIADTRIFSPLTVPGLCVTIGRQLNESKPLSALRTRSIFRSKHIAANGSGKVVAKSIKTQ